MLRKSIFEPFSGHLPFSGVFFTHFLGEAQIHFSSFFVPISGRRPEMDLYQVHGTTTRNQKQELKEMSLKK